MPKMPWLALFTGAAPKTTRTEPEAATAPPAGVPQAPAVPAASGLTPAAAIAALVTLASVVFTTWAVYDLLAPHAPAVVALAAGIGLELVWLFALSTEYQQAKGTGRIEARLSVTGWVLAAVTAAVIALHGVLTAWPLVALAVLPLAAKAGWRMRTRHQAGEANARLQAEAAARAEQDRAEREAAEAERVERAEAQRRAQALSSELSEQQQAELAELEQQAEYVRRRTEKEMELEEAEAKAEQQRSLAQIHRDAEQQMATDEASAQVQVRRHELAQRIHRSSPVYTVTELPAVGGEQVPNDASSLDPGTPGGFATSRAGFGSAMASVARTGTGPEHQVPGVPEQSGTHHSEAEGEQNRRKVAGAYKALLIEHQTEPSIAAVARATDLSDRAAGRHLRSLGLRS